MNPALHSRSHNTSGWAFQRNRERIVLAHGGDILVERLSPKGAGFYSVAIS